MSDEATGKSGKTWVYVVGWLVSFPLLYVLSIGPACVLFSRGYVPQKIIVGFYEPLEWAIPHSSPLGRPIKNYIELWLNLTGTPKP